jgi:hypothetical protein
MNSHANQLFKNSKNIIHNPFEIFDYHTHSSVIFWIFIYNQNANNSLEDQKKMKAIHLNIYQKIIYLIFKVFCYLQPNNQLTSHQQPTILCISLTIRVYTLWLLPTNGVVDIPSSMLTIRVFHTLWSMPIILMGPFYGQCQP